MDNVNRRILKKKNFEIPSSDKYTHTHIRTTKPNQTKPYTINNTPKYIYRKKSIAPKPKKWYILEYGCFFFQWWWSSSSSSKNKGGSNGANKTKKKTIQTKNGCIFFSVCLCCCCCIFFFCLCHWMLLGEWWWQNKPTNQSNQTNLSNQSTEGKVVWKENMKRMIDSFANFQFKSINRSKFCCFWCRFFHSKKKFRIFYSGSGKNQKNR